MKRSTGTLIVIASLLFPAAGIAGLSDWNGDIAEGGFMAFDQKNGGKTVKAFEWSDAPIQCETGSVTVSEGKISGALNVNRRDRFKGKDREGGYVEKVTGKFTEAHETKGTIRVKGDIGDATGCDTDTLRWIASDL